MSDVFPVFVPSKGRATTARAPGLLAEAGVPCAVVVERQELAAYEAALGTLPGVRFEVLPESEQGIAYVRNWIHDVARERGLGWYWMLDDDVNGFAKVADGRCVNATAREALSSAQRVFAHAGASGIGQAALEYRQYAWTARKPYVLADYCDVVVAVHAGRTAALRYRKEMTLKEDRDFTLQVLAAGMMTCRVQTHCFNAPRNGSNAGGLKPVYDSAGREEEAVRRMVAAWPGVCRPITKGDGRVDVRIDWGRFKPQKRKTASLR